MQYFIWVANKNLKSCEQCGNKLAYCRFIKITFVMSKKGGKTAVAEAQYVRYSKIILGTENTVRD